MASATLRSCEVGTHLTAHCYAAEIMETRIISETLLVCLIFDHFTSFEDISRSHLENANLHVGGQSSLKVFCGELFDRIKALKSKRQPLKMNIKPHASFETAGWAKKLS